MADLHKHGKNASLKGQEIFFPLLNTFIHFTVLAVRGNIFVEFPPGEFCSLYLERDYNSLKEHLLCMKNRIENIGGPRYLRILGISEVGPVYILWR